MWHVALGSWQWIRPVAAPCNVTCSSGIMTLNSPGGSTLQCGRWLWDNMPLNSPKCPPYWNSTSGFDFGHIAAVDMSFCTSLRNFIKIRPPSAEKMTSCRFLRWRLTAILDFRGPIMDSLKIPRTTSYRSSIERDHSSKLLSFWESHVFFVFWRQTDKQTDRLTNRWTGPLHEAAVASGALTNEYVSCLCLPETVGPLKAVQLTIKQFRVKTVT